MTFEETIMKEKHREETLPPNLALPSMELATS